MKSLSVVKGRPEMSFDSVSKQRSSLSNLLFSADRKQRYTTMDKRSTSINNNERSLSKISVSKVNLKPSILKNPTVPFSPTSSSHTSYTKKLFSTTTTASRANFLLGGADIPMFKTTVSTENKGKRITSGGSQTITNGSLVRNVHQALGEIRQSRQVREKGQ